MDKSKKNDHKKKFQTKEPSFKTNQKVEPKNKKNVVEMNSDSSDVEQEEYDDEVQKLDNLYDLQTELKLDQVSPATKLLEKRRKMYEVNEAFEIQKQDFKKQEALFFKQEEAIRERDQQIQKDLIRFCRFLQENEAKQIRANKRFQEEEKAKMFQLTLIEQVKTEIEELLAQQSMLEKKVATLKKYEDYLEKVMKSNNQNSTDQQQDLTEIVQRYKTLVKSNDHLSADYKELDQKYERIKQESAQFERERNRDILQLSNNINEIKKKLEDKQSEKNNLANQVDNTMNEVSKNNLNRGKILIAIDNIFQRCTSNDLTKIKYENASNKTIKEKEKSDQDKKEDDSEVNDQDNVSKKIEISLKKLKTISQYINDLKTIVEICKQDQRDKDKNQ